VEKIPTRINGRQYYLNEEMWTVDWKDLEELDLDLAERIQNLATRYSYDL